MVQPITVYPQAASKDYILISIASLLVPKKKMNSNILTEMPNRY